jgi:uncharacterized protein
MLVVISPAKKLDYETPTRVRRHSIPDFASESEKLIRDLRKRSVDDLRNLMSINETLAKLNRDRYKKWSREPAPENARQAMLAFMGDVYVGLDARSFGAREVNYAQGHLRILSGLYGILRPLDLMQPYRLEMGTRLSNARGPDLYSFWGTTLATALNEQAAAIRTRYLVNLASHEYFDAIDTDALDLEVITPVFKERMGEQYRVLSFFAKKTRGMMARYILQTRPKRPEELRGFDIEGYAFDEVMSSASKLVFTRDKP